MTGQISLHYSVTITLMRTDKKQIKRMTVELVGFILYLYNIPYTVLLYFVSYFVCTISCVSTGVSIMLKKEGTKEKIVFHEMSSSLKTMEKKVSSP